MWVVIDNTPALSRESLARPALSSSASLQRARNSVSSAVLEPNLQPSAPAAEEIEMGLL